MCVSLSQAVLPEPEQSPKTPEFGGDASSGVRGPVTADTGVIREALP